MKVASVPRLSPLRDFAGWFHQGFGLQFPDVPSGCTVMIEQLSGAERKLLYSELAAFLASHEGRSEKVLRRAWMKLGVQHWPRRADTRSLLTGFLVHLRKAVGCEFG
jgi:hypothetical protein